MKSSPTSTASTGLCKCTLGKPGMAPNNTSSMLGCVAAVIETESPSQPRPAVIQRMCTSLTAEAFCVDRPYGTVAVPILLAPFPSKFDPKDDALMPVVDLSLQTHPITSTKLDRDNSKLKLIPRIDLRPNPYKGR